MGDKPKDKTARYDGKSAVTNTTPNKVPPIGKNRKPLQLPAATSTQAQSASKSEGATNKSAAT